MLGPDLGDLLTRAADALLSDQPVADDGVDQILGALMYGPQSKDGAAPAQRRHRAQLLRMAARFKRLFQFEAADAPGLVFFGAELAPVLDPHSTPSASASGAGMSLQSAFQSCVGEGAEFLSQFERGGDVVARLPSEAPPQDAPAETPALLAALEPFRCSEGREVDWVAGRRVSDGTSVHLAADVCLRRRAEDRTFAPPFPLSIGCAAGPSRDEAVLHGLLELIERDAVALWWRGGRRGKLVGAEDREHVEQALLNRIRGASSRRRTWLLDISSDLGVPCVAAISADAAGREVACGFAARLSMATACRAATIEMCQMELGYSLIDMKRRQGGEQALNDRDREHLHRRERLDASCPMLQAVALPSLASPRPPGAVFEDLRDLASVLSRAGVEAYEVDLTRPEYGIPVVRVLAPTLQLEPCAIVTERLAAILSATGGPLQTCSQQVSLL